MACHTHARAHTRLPCLPLFKQRRSSTTTSSPCPSSSSSWPPTGSCTACGVSPTCATRSSWAWRASAAPSASVSGAEGAPAAVFCMSAALPVLRSALNPRLPPPPPTHTTPTTRTFHTSQLHLALVPLHHHALHLLAGGLSEQDPAGRHRPRGLQCALDSAQPGLHSSGHARGRRLRHGQEPGLRRLREAARGAGCRLLPTAAAWRCVVSSGPRAPRYPGLAMSLVLSSSLFFLLSHRTASSLVHARPGPAGLAICLLSSRRSVHAQYTPFAPRRLPPLRSPHCTKRLTTPQLQTSTKTMRGGAGEGRQRPPEICPQATKAHPAGGSCTGLK